MINGNKQILRKKYQNGYIYTDKNIDELLLRKHIGKKLRKAGKNDFKIKKRTKNDNDKFIKNFINIIERAINL